MQPVQSKNFGRRATFAIMLLAGMVAALAGCSADRNAARNEAASRIPGEPAQLSYPYLTTRESQVAGFREMAERTAGSYVRITLHARRDPYDEGPPGTSLHTGSGVILDREGHILTVAHIARGKEFTPEIVFRDGLSVRGRIIAISPEQELALIRINPPRELVPARLAEPNSVREGEFTMAIGSPGRQWGVVSLGWVTNPDIGERLQYGDWGFENAIEIAMKVEIGHSGGPVFNRAGNLIGIVAGFELGPPGTPQPPPRIAYVVPVRNIRAWLRNRIPGLIAAHADMELQENPVAESEAR